MSPSDEHQSNEKAADGAATIAPFDSKPRLRGVLHEYAFFVSLVAGALLVLTSPTGRPRIVAAAYAFTLAALFGVSALYHRATWTVAQRRWLRRLDHTMIFLLIAGTYTPFTLLVLPYPLGTTLLAIVWLAALGGAVFNLVWLDAPRWISAVIYVAIGWVCVAAIPDLLRIAGPAPLALLALGGVAYSAGALIYAIRKPDPVPAVFGYHEVFHLLVIIAAGLHFAAVAVYALPS